MILESLRATVWDAQPLKRRGICLTFKKIYIFAAVFVIDSQISEVAKMLYQQGLTELIHSSPSEQVAYLLVERASLLESSEATDRLTRDGTTAALPEMEAQAPVTAEHQVSGITTPAIQNK